MISPSPPLTSRHLASPVTLPSITQERAGEYLRSRSEGLSVEPSVELMEMTSQEALPRLISEGRVGTYSIIYIDGLHMPQGALLDAVLSWHLLAVDGIMIFDDYHHPDEKQSTARGVDAFLDAYGSELEVLHSEGDQKWVRKVAHSNVIAEYAEHEDGSMSVGEVPVG